MTKKKKKELFDKYKQSSYWAEYREYWEKLHIRKNSFKINVLDFVRSYPPSKTVDGYITWTALGYTLNCFQNFQSFLTIHL